MAESKVDILLRLKAQVEGREGAISFLRNFQGLLATIAASAPVFAIKQAGNMARDLKALAAQSQISTDVFQTLRYEFAKDGVEAHTLAEALVKLREGLQDARTNEKSPIASALRDLGLSAAGLQVLRPEQQLDAIGRAINNAADKNKAFNAALELLGGSLGSKVLDSIRRLGIEGFDRWRGWSSHLELNPEQLETLNKAGMYLQRIADWLKVISSRAIANVGGFSDAMAKDRAGMLQAGSMLARDGGWAGGVSSQGAIGMRLLAGVMENAANAARAAKGERIPGSRLPPIDPKTIVEDPAEIRRKAEIAEQDAKMRAEKEKAAREASIAQRRRLATAATTRELDLAAKITARVTAEMRRNDDEVERLAESFRQLGDPTRTYAQQLEQVDSLERANILTAKEAAAARAQLTAEIRRADSTSANRLADLQAARAEVEGNPFLLLSTRRRAAAALLAAENKELDKQIQLLREKATLTSDDQRYLGELTTRRAQNANDRSGFSFGQELGADLTAYANSFGTLAQQVSGTITGTIGAAVDSVAQGITGWITGTNSWGAALRSLGTTALNLVLQGLIRIGVQQLLNAVLARTLQAAGTAATLALVAAESKALAALWATPATLATIATGGGAAMTAPGFIMAANATTQATALFQKGGYTGDGPVDQVAGLVHRNEYVVDAGTLHRYGGPAYFDAMRFAAPVRAAATPAALASPAKRERLIAIVPDMNSARALARDPNFDNIMVDVMRRNRGDIWGSAG